jgi:putative redox protein
MNATISWIKDMMFAAESGSGHTIVIDGAPEEMVLLGLGGCTSIDVIDILKKSRADVTDCVTQLTAERADGIPAVFTGIHVHFVVTGRNLKRRHVERAIELSATKYCSASLMLSADTEFFGLSAIHGPRALPLFKHVRKVPVDPFTGLAGCFQQPARSGTPYRSSASRPGSSHP